MAATPQITLNNGVMIPQFGLGVFQVSPGDTAETVATALRSGYQLIDTAQMYGNERQVGEGIARSGVPREDVFVTTKLANDLHGHDDAMRALEDSLAELGTDYVDLYLIHWPWPKQDRYVETWQAFEKLAAAGRTRAIGVSNFQPEHLDRLAAACDTVPAVNQIELHPLFQQADLRAYHARHGIATQAWSPIAQGKALHDQAITALARRHDRTPAQIVLRWHIQLGNIVFPKSATPSRIAENIDIFDFELTDDDMAAIASVDRGLRTGPDPERFP